MPLRFPWTAPRILFEQESNSIRSGDRLVVVGGWRDSYKYIFIETKDKIHILHLKTKTIELHGRKQQTVGKIYRIKRITFFGTSIFLQVHGIVMYVCSVKACLRHLETL